MSNTPKNQETLIALPHLEKTASAESNALTSATVANWMVVADDWNTSEGTGPARGWDPQNKQWYKSRVTQFELDLTCDAAETLTGTPKLFSLRLFPITVADDTFTSSGSDNINTATSHGMNTGDGPFQLTTSGTLPDPLALETDYYVEDLSANTFALHLTRQSAITGGAGVITTDTGSGTHTIADRVSQPNKDNDTRRFFLQLVGELNDGSDIALTAGAQGYHERINHSPLSWGYVLVATETSTETIEMRITPLVLGED